MQLKNSLSSGLLFVLLSGLVLSSQSAIAQDVVMVIAQDASMVNHYPGLDGLIGNDDDVISGDLTDTQKSAANSNGSFGHNAFLFSPFGPQESSVPAGFDAITFVDGTITVDSDVMKNGGGPIITALNITSGTEPFPGHGDYTATVTAVNSGAYDKDTMQFTLNVDITYTIFGNSTTEPGVILTGTAIYRESADYGNPTGNDYMDDVAVPFAQTSGSASVVFFTGTGMLPNLGFPITASLVALDNGAFKINAGLNDAWVSDDAPFQGFFFTVFPDFEFFFLSWFTFDSVVPTGPDTAVFGAFDQRWVTGSGFFSGNSVTLNMELTTGGTFNSDTPLATQDTAYGTITILFLSCNEALLTYDFPTVGLSGQMTLKRVLPDNIALCEELAMQ